MVPDQDIAEEIAEFLLDIQAVKLNLKTPFKWSSGWNSPIYCDNRQTLSYPEIRSAIKSKLATAIIQEFKEIELIAGVATAGIAIGALIADSLDLPFVYVRPEAKKHGLSNQIEGHLKNGQRTVVIEDLISTGMSSLKVVDSLRKSGANVIGLAAIFTYGFPKAEFAFKQASCPYITLTDYTNLIGKYASLKVLTEEETQSLRSWREAPDQWNAKPN